MLHPEARNLDVCQLRSTVGGCACTVADFCMQGTKCGQGWDRRTDKIDLLLGIRDVS